MPFEQILKRLNNGHNIGPFDFDAFLPLLPPLDFRAFFDRIDVDDEAVLSVDRSRRDERECDDVFRLEPAPLPPPLLWRRSAPPRVSFDVERERERRFQRSALISRVFWRSPRDFAPFSVLRRRSRASPLLLRDCLRVLRFGLFSLLRDFVLLRDLSRLLERDRFARDGLFLLDLRATGGLDERECLRLRLCLPPRFLSLLLESRFLVARGDTGERERDARRRRGGDGDTGERGGDVLRRGTGGDLERENLRPRSRFADFSERFGERERDDGRRFFDFLELPPPFSLVDVERFFRRGDRDRDRLERRFFDDGDLLRERLLEYIQRQNKNIRSSWKRMWLE